jgi:hypothetical protein
LVRFEIRERRSGRIRKETTRVGVGAGAGISNTDTIQYIQELGEGLVEEKGLKIFFLHFHYIIGKQGRRERGEARIP